VTALGANYTGSKTINFTIKSAAVSGLRTSTIKNNSIRLAWTKQDYADGYQICNSKNRVLGTTTKNSYTVKNLTSCTTYKLKVRAYTKSADGSVSYGDFSTAVAAKTLLNTPKTLKVASTGKGKVTLTWSKVAKATGYELYYSTKKNGVYTRIKRVSQTGTRKYTHKGLTSGVKYYYTIRAYRTVNGVTTYSKYITIKSVKVK
jgi:ribosomal protein S8